MLTDLEWSIALRNFYFETKRPRESYEQWFERTSVEDMLALLEKLEYKKSKKAQSL